ncbi:LOW QUALITY PROTEIN: phosphatidylinositol phosphatase PTPRQ-like [Rhipicephalus sanguineus]|uniref:LOW QUALITY PROTEIN: phosphatidylinositol phosphatase PTPRQ-like n=1 Tax=Rhipicephalus sanguineus TaxID=34632 RepID=UPI0020C2B76B|nr:LOW QUALITY PROTEIN: phosphatidylinositol phosphatase PTPRQ-like [Rhipicephalus sanguineus]
MYRIPTTPFMAVTIRLRLRTPDNKYSSWTKRWNVTSAEDAPGAVTNVKLLRSGSRNATISWGPPEQKNGVIRNYRVVYTPLAFLIQPCQALNEPDTTVMVSPTHHSVNLTPLHPYTKYRLSITALTSKYGPEKNTTFETDQAVPEGVPTQLRYTRFSQDTDTLTWAEVPCERRNGPITSYAVEVYSDDPWETKLRTNNTVSGTSVAYRDLMPYTHYQAEVYACNGAGRSPFFAFLNFTTPSAVPDAPASTWSSEQTESSLKIQWDPPVRKNGALTGYKLNSSLSHTFNDIRAESRLPKSELLNISGSPEFYLRGLVPGSTYLVCVQAKTSAGFGNAICDNFTTKVSAPDSPARIWSSEQTERSIKVQWDPPVRKNGALTGYKLNSSLSHTFNGIPANSWLPKSDLLNISASPEFYLRDLIPGSTYLVCVEAKTSAGFGNDICDNFTTKASVPDAPASIWSSEETESSMRIQWDPPIRKNGALKGYKLNSSLSHTYNDILAKLWLPKSVLINSSNSLEFYLQDLVPGSTYLVCVEAKTSAGSGNAICDNFSTRTSAPDAPASIWSSEQTESSLKIHWEPPLRKNGALTGYKLKSSLSHTFNGLPTKSWLPMSDLLNISDSTVFYLRGLVPGSTYLVCVEAETSAGFGNAICDNFITKDSAPDAPASIWSPEQTESSLKIQWDPPVRPNGALTGYKLNCSLYHTYNSIMDRSWLSNWVSLNSSDSPEFYLQSLVPGSTYSVCVEAETSAGFGNAICDNFSTKDSVPDAPASIWSSEQSDSTLKIQWEPPVRKNGALKGYKLNTSLSHTFNSVLDKLWLPKHILLNSSDSPEYHLQDLVPGSTYLVCVEAETSAGFGNAICDDFSTDESANSSLSHTFNGILAKSWVPKSDFLNSSDSTEYYLSDLVPGSTYLVCVEAQTSAGFGNPICDNFSTKTSVPDAPTSIWSSEQTEHSLKIQWRPPVRKNGALTSYKLNSSLSHTFNGMLDESWLPKLVLLNISDLPEFDLEDLVPGSKYLVCVEAETSAGFGNAICDNFSTKDAEPDAPASIWSSEQTENSLKIEWDPPVCKNGALRGYKLNSSLSHTFNGILEKSWFPKLDLLNSSDSPEFYLEGLVPGSTYMVCVAAETSAGFGKAICDNFTTKASVPEVQVEPKVGAIVHNKVSIMLNPVDFMKGPITGYYVIVLREGEAIPRPVKLVNHSTSQDMGLGYYVAAHLTPDLLEKPMDFVVGSGNVVGGFENPPLSDATTYRFGLLVESNFSGEVLHGYSLTAPVTVTGGSSVTEVGVVIGAGLLLLILVTAAGLTFCCIRRRQAAAYSSKSSTIQCMKELQSRLSELDDNRTSESCSTPTTEESDNLNIANEAPGSLASKTASVKRPQEHAINGEESGPLKEESSL